MQPQNTNQEPAPDYSFLAEPAKPPRRPLLPAAGSSATRALFIGLCVVVLLIIFVVLKSALGGSNKAIPAMLSVAQQQQALVHLAQNGAQNATSDTLKNFLITAQLSLQSEQQQIITYLQTNHHKTSQKEVNLGLAGIQATDTQLSNALSASNFDDAYKGVMQSRLTGYERTLQSAYTQVKGPNGRSLLQADYKGAQLLGQQLGD